MQYNTNNRYHNSVFSCYLYSTLTCFGTIYLHFQEPKILVSGTQVNGHMASLYRPWYAGHLVQRKNPKRYACFVYKIFHKFIARPYLQENMQCLHDDYIFMTMLKTRWHQYGGIAQASLYQLPPCWMTRVFMASGKRDRILGWMVIWGWRYITYCHEKVCCKEGQ